MKRKVLRVERDTAIAVSCPKGARVVVIEVELPTVATGRDQMVLRQSDVERLVEMLKEAHAELSAPPSAAKPGDAVESVLLGLEVGNEAVSRPE
jgi:hypothetical protein